MRYFAEVGGEVFEIEVGPEGRVSVDGQEIAVDLEGVGDGRHYSLLIGNRSYDAHVECDEGGESVLVVAGRSYRVRLDTYRPAAARNGDGASARAGEIRAPLPGMLVRVPVKAGENVTEGQVVAVLESMKMNLELRSPLSGIVRKLSAEPGDEVTQGEVLMTIGP
ncbi:MAG: biotin/lipoyl-binding protein [Chloroflexi bacterium]|nr:biotin/lipoyl-binding protein [Chloroflexota bacterium]